MYLSTRRLDEAEAIYDEFALLDEQEPHYATGLAGKAVIASLRDDYKESNRIIAELAPIFGEPNVLHEHMKRLVGKAIAKNQRLSGEPINGRLENLFEPTEEQGPFE